MRSRAALTLGEIGAEVAIPGLLELLKNSDANVRSSSALALGEIGAEVAIPDLLELLKDSDARVRSKAADALSKIDTKTHSVVMNLSQWINEHQDSQYIGDGVDLLWDLVCG